MANRITTIIDLVSDGASRGLRNFRTALSEADGLTNKFKAGWSSAMTELKSSPATQAAVAAGAVTMAAASVKAASDLGESVNAVGVAYGQAGDEVLALGENSATAFGLSQRAFNQFSTQFSAFATKIASSEGRAIEDVVGEMTTRIADFASVYNLSMEEAAQVAQSTLAGETESFRRFGGDVSAAAVELFALKNGLVDNKSEMTEAIKVQARYGLFMEQTAKVAGDFANTQDSLANQQRIATAQAEDLAAKLGTVLIPVFAEATAAANDFAAGLQEIIDKAGQIPGLDAILGEDMGDLAQRGRQLYDITFKVINPIGTIGRLAAGPVSDGLGKLGDAFGFGGDQAEEFVTSIGDVRDATLHANTTLDQYINTLEGRYSAAHSASSAAVEAARLQLERYVESLEAAHDAAQTGAGGTRDAAFELSSGLDELADRLDKTGDSADDAATGIDGYSQSLRDALPFTDKLAQSVDALTSAFDAESLTLDYEDALARIEEGERRIAEAREEFGRGSEEESQAIRDQRRNVIRLNETVLELLETYEDIPFAKQTVIHAAMEAGDVAEVERLLAEITRDRFIRATVVPVKQNSFDSAVIDIARGVAPSGPTYTNPNPAPTTTSTPTVIDQSRTTIVYPVGTTPRSQRVNTDLDDRRNGYR